MEVEVVTVVEGGAVLGDLWVVLVVGLVVGKGLVVGQL